jgi:hypothetical protein
MKQAPPMHFLVVSDRAYSQMCIGAEYSDLVEPDFLLDQQFESAVTDQ